MRMLKILTAVFLMVMSAPALADRYFAVTPSGAAEMLFAEAPADVSGKISSRCIDLKWTVIGSSASEVTCEAPLSFGQSVLGQMLMGNSYSTPPRRFFRFTVASLNGISRVQASGWMELQMAFGQMKRNDFSGPEFQNGAMTFLASAGGKYPPGTTFPNHAAMGVDVDYVTQDGYQALKITRLQPGMPAEKAGLKVGDVVTRIANKRFKTTEDYLDATAKAAEKPTYEIEVLRDGQTMKITVERAMRPAWTEQIVAAAPTVPIASAPAPMSVADEIAKLAKLKADGVLTASEFDAQKKKLLGQ